MQVEWSDVAIYSDEVPCGARDTVLGPLKGFDPTRTGPGPGTSTDELDTGIQSLEQDQVRVLPQGPQER